MKRMISIMLVIVMLLSLVPAAEAVTISSESKKEPVEIDISADDNADSAELPPVQTDISLSMGTDQSQMNFTWYADSAEAGTLLLAKNDDVQNGQMPEDAAAFQAAATVANNGSYSNQVTATGLEAGATYTYQLVNGEDYSNIMTFTTASEGAFSFAYVGDPQIGAGGNVTNDTKGWVNTLSIVDENEIFSDISFMLSAGDQVNTASSETEYDGYLNHDVLQTLPVATVIGNHDSGSDAYNEHFNLANESSEYGTTNAGGDSWFVYNNVLFLVLNSNDQSAAEHKAFLEAAIEANPDVSWKVVTFHHSLYTVASHASDNDILSRRNALVPIFEELDIDVVLMGHDHVYCRTYIMDGLTPMTDASLYDDADYSSITNPDGILYVTANSGSGSKTYNIKNQVFPYSAVQNQEHVANISKIAVSDEQFTITTYRTTDMTVIDTFSINRTSDVSMAVNGETETTIDAEKLTYTVSAKDLVNVATATLTFEIDDTYLADPTVETPNGWYVIVESYQNGKLTVIMGNNAGVTGEADLLNVTVKTTGKTGEVQFAVTDAVLSAYVGDGEAYVNVVLTDASLTTCIDCSIYDVNCDGIVDQLDLTRAQRFFGSDNADADVNTDGIIDINDLILIVNHYTR